MLFRLCILRRVRVPKEPERRRKERDSAEVGGSDQPIRMDAAGTGMSLVHVIQFSGKQTLTQHGYKQKRDMGSSSRTLNKSLELYFFYKMGLGFTKLTSCSISGDIKVAFFGNAQGKFLKFGERLPRFIIPAFIRHLQTNKSKVVFLLFLSCFPTLSFDYKPQTAVCQCSSKILFITHKTCKLMLFLPLECPLK